jgi:hypothetical protein
MCDRLHIADPRPMHISPIIEPRQGAVMTGPSYEEKRQIFERHFLLGQLSSDEIDTLLHFARTERYAADDEIYVKGSPAKA